MSSRKEYLIYSLARKVFSVKIVLVTVVLL